MSNQRLPLNINVGFFYNLPIGSHRDIHFEFPTLHFPPDLDVNDFKGKVHISRTPQGLLFEGKFKAAAAAECVRCLESCTHDLEFEINLSLITAGALKNILDGFKNSKLKVFPYQLLMKDVLIKEDRILKAINK